MSVSDLVNLKFDLKMEVVLCVNASCLDAETGRESGGEGGGFLACLRCASYLDTLADSRSVPKGRALLAGMLQWICRVCVASRRMQLRNR